MNSNLNYFVTGIRKSVLNQLNSANSMFDLVIDMSLELQKLPENVDDNIKEKLTEDISKLFQIAKSLSDNASRVGDDLAKLVD